MLHIDIFTVDLLSTPLNYTSKYISKGVIHNIIQSNMPLQPPLLSNNLSYVTLIFISCCIAFHINLSWIKWPPVLCDHVSMFPWTDT